MLVLPSAMIKLTFEGHISKNPKNLPSRSTSIAFRADNAVASANQHYTQVEYAWEMLLGLVVWGGGGVENGVWVGSGVSGCRCGVCENVKMCVNVLTNILFYWIYYS